MVSWWIFSRWHTTSLQRTVRDSRCTHKTKLAPGVRNNESHIWMKRSNRRIKLSRESSFTQCLHACSSVKLQYDPTCQLSATSNRHLSQTLYSLSKVFCHSGNGNQARWQPHIDFANLQHYSIPRLENSHGTVVQNSLKNIINLFSDSNEKQW